MRKIALGFCLAIACSFLALPAVAAPVQQSELQGASQNGPLFVNDHDGGIMPNENGDPDFVINPDGQAQDISDRQEQPAQDQDEDGDISMYQGQDDIVPC